MNYKHFTKEGKNLC